MATLESQLTSLAERIGQECKAINDNVGVLANLSTTAKTSLVEAINEQASSLNTLSTTVSTNGGNIATLQSAVNSLQSATANLLTIDDVTASTSTLYSSSKVEDVVAASAQSVKDDLLGGAGTAYDTLKELADLITTNQDAISALQALAAGHVKYDEAQSLTTAQQAQARTNIDALGTTETAAAATKLETGRTIQTSLSLTTAATFDGTSNVTPGVTGTLGIANGGTGANTAAAALTNLGAASATDLSTLQTQVDTLEANIGDTGVDLVTAFETALAGS